MYDTACPSPCSLTWFIAPFQLLHTRICSSGWLNYNCVSSDWWKEWLYSEVQWSYLQAKSRQNIRYSVIINNAFLGVWLWKYVECNASTFLHFVRGWATPALNWDVNWYYVAQRWAISISASHWQIRHCVPWFSDTWLVPVVFTSYWCLSGIYTYLAFSFYSCPRAISPPKIDYSSFWIRQ